MVSRTTPLGADGSVLVVGGAGYIGSHAAKALASTGRRVIVYDNLSSGHREAVKWGDLVVGDIRDEACVGAALREHAVTSVMHFAALSQVGASVTDPSGYYQNNVEGTLSLLRAMVAGRVKRLVFSSTAAVFGNPERTPIDEGHPTRPINPYGDTKLAIEHALVHFARAYGLESVVLRYFNAAGADPEGEIGEDHTPESHLIPLAIDAALGGAPLRVFGEDYPTPDGTCLRDYIHVADLASAHALALNRLEQGGTSATYNLGNGRPFSVKAVIDAVAHVGGQSVPWVPAPRREGDPAVLFASSRLIQSELGWVPRFTEPAAIVDTAWQWRMRHPHGYSKGA
jgi:UDP-glucose-4-epimerase GalE